ncbi:hypothetical protein Tco_1400305 [Tanacetum coccineum]
MGKEDVIEPVPRDLPVVQTYEDERDMNDGCDITVEDVERLRKILTPSIHTLPNLKPIEQPYMPLGLVCNKEKVKREEEQDYDIPLQDHIMQPLTPQTVYIMPPDDDYVAPATNLILNKHLNEFEEELDDYTRVSKKIDSNPVNDLKELLKTYDFETFIWKLLHQLSQSSHKTGKAKREMKSHQRGQVSILAKDKGFGHEMHKDPYDDDMYKGQDLPQVIQAICDNLDIRVQGRKEK